MSSGISSFWWVKRLPWLVKNEASYEAVSDLEGRTNKRSIVGVRGVVAGFVVLVCLVGFISTRWIDGTMPSSMVNSIPHPHHPPYQSKPFKLACPNQTSPSLSSNLCRTTTIASPPSPAPSPYNDPLITSSSPSCPSYFRWIHEDLKPWASTGITRDMVERAQSMAAFRLLVIGGRLYVEQYHRVFQTRDLFTLWGFVQLANRFPGRLPDLDLMFNCEDPPTVKNSPSPPPLFRYCKDDTTVDILFPDWSFWGWAEINIKPWKELSEEMKDANKRVKWKKRRPYAYWKGNEGVSRHRQDLMRCNPSHGHDWNARVHNQDWESEIKNGFKESNLAEQCTYRYKIFVEGRSWSVSEKYTLACDSPNLFVTTHFYDFMTRSLMPGQHFWPINENTICRSIKFAVDWGNKNQDKAQKIGKKGSGFILEEVSMDYVYQYMLHLLTEYAKLLRYKPSLPEKATELFLESMACDQGGKVREFLMESMVSWASNAEPCTLPPPYGAEELEELRSKKNAAIKEVEKWEKEAWDKGH
ncbi:protein O-glucosyltransferase 1-like [Zingiber officinale]|uniref:protein O-glucosyltransferase 1-like n=1 Tax=Zingiber officinale TaxID=94328 RepID=UPI001C4C6148|nr:protein O-glucosyltransferase 1-like [Zingiber officinale]XP_042440699.1 protein O-glucosyltransferase 1-like [Zingiber officinale]